MRRLAVALPLLLAANYAFLVTRHEAAHAAVAIAAGARVEQLHLWPPRGWSLSWIVVSSPPGRSAGSIALQAGMPYLISLALLLGSLYWLASAPREGIARLLVSLAGIWFPLLDLALGVAPYWWSRGDLVWILGPASTGSCLLLSALVLALAAVSAWIEGVRR